MEENTYKDGRPSLIFDNKKEKNYFLYYYHIGKDFENTRSDTDV